MSRLPLRETLNLSSDLPEVILMMENMDNSPISSHDIAVRTKRDPLMSQVYRYIQEGWPTTCDEELKRRNSLPNMVALCGVVEW